MDLISDDGARVILSTRVSASAERVFALFTTADGLTQWWPEQAEVDLQPGGAYHLFWEGPGWHLRGTYQAVDAPWHVSFTWSWDHEDTTQTVEVDLAEDTDDAGHEGTTLLIAHTYSTAEERDGYVEGWTFFVSKLLEHTANS